jgi:hypothetical protein
LKKLLLRPMFLHRPHQDPLKRNPKLMISF